MFRCASFAMWILLTATTAAAQATLPDLVAHGVNPVDKSVLRDVAVHSIEELGAGADVIVEGGLVKSRNYLSKDNREVDTDYIIQPIRSFAGPATPPRKAPGVTRMIVTLRGGETQINGVPVTFSDDNLAEFASVIGFYCS